MLGIGWGMRLNRVVAEILQTSQAPFVTAAAGRPG